MLDGVSVGAHELFTPSELAGGLQCPKVNINQERTSPSCCESEQMDCSRGGRTADYY